MVAIFLDLSNDRDGHLHCRTMFLSAIKLRKVIHVRTVFAFFCHICWTKVFSDPEIARNLLPWQRDVNDFSSLYSPVCKRTAYIKWPQKFVKVVDSYPALQPAHALV